MHQQLAIKVCGMKQPFNIREVSGLRIQYIGLIFYPGSSRFVGDLEPVNLPGQIEKVGVFVNQPIEYILEQAKRHSLAYIQLHGEEDQDFCKKLVQEGCKIIKAFRVGSAEDFQSVQLFEPFCAYFLFDAKGKTYGGTGRQFDWSLLNVYNGTTDFLLSGGITVADAGSIRNLNHPRLAGVDINSGFEMEPGIKSIQTIKTFIHELRS
jgi:phosphoribosylanthranilate isomerase